MNEEIVSLLLQLLLLVGAGAVAWFMKGLNGRLKTGEDHFTKLDSKISTLDSAITGHFITLTETINEVSEDIRQVAHDREICEANAQATFLKSAEFNGQVKKELEVHEKVYHAKK